MDDIILDNRNVETPKNEPIRPITSVVPKKKKKPSGFGSYLFNLLTCVLITVSLFGISFILFASSGPINIFNGSSSLRPEVLYILIGMFVLVAILYFCLSFLNILLYLLTALASAMFTYSIFNQFANFSADLTGARSNTFAAVLTAVIVFALMIITPKRIKALMLMAAVFCFGAVLVNQNKEKSEFISTLNMPEMSIETDEPAHKLINIMVANAPAYSYVSSLKNTDVSEIYKKQLMQIMLGFYAKNGFKLYPNAYITHNNQFVNAARSLNYDAKEDANFLQNQVLKDGYWQFKNREDYEAYLKDNSFYDKLQAQQYKISAYQSHGINLCMKNNKNNVNRCISKINQPINVDSLKLTTAEKVNILLVQWLENTGWFKNESMMGKIYSYLKPLYNPASTPLIGTSYSKLYVINTFRSLDALLDDFNQDKGNNAYFIYLDLPSDMYVYDDLCQLKLTDEWLVKQNQPWVENKNMMEKRNAYLKQTMCLFGQLEKAMRIVNESAEADNTTVIIQGLSGMDDLIGTPNQDLSDRFRNGEMVAMAIKTPGSKQFVINKSICPVEEIINNTLNNGPKCTDFNRTTLSKTTKKNVAEIVSLVRYTNDIAQKSLQEFNRWYKDWNRVNYRSAAASPLLYEGQGVTKSSSSNAMPERIPAAKAQLMPLEEKNISKQKIMSGQINVGREANVKSISKASEEPVARK